MNETVRIEEANAWLRKAALDLRAAEHDLAGNDELRSDAAFHAQQAAEKSWKALLAWHDVPFRKTHSLEELGQQCSSLDSSLAALVADAAPLTEYAWKFRYPGELGEATQEEAEAALTIARRVYQAVHTRVPGV